MWCNTHRILQDWCYSFTALQQQQSPGLCVVKTVLLHCSHLWGVCVLRIAAETLWRPSLCWRLCAGTFSPLINLYHPPSRQQTRRTALSHSQTQSYWRQLASSILWTLAHLSFSVSTSLLVVSFYSSSLSLFLFPTHIFAPSYFVCMYVFIYLRVWVCVRRADSDDGNCVLGNSDTSTLFIHTNSLLRNATLFLLFINQILRASTVTESREISASFTIVISKVGNVIEINTICFVVTQFYTIHF